MRIAGGILTLIAGSCTFLLAGAIVFFGDLLSLVTSAYGTEAFQGVSLVGWLGLLFSSVLILLGATALVTKRAWAGIGIMAFAGLGLLLAGTDLLLGGSGLAMLMVLTFVGGLLAWMGTREAVR